MRPSGLNSAVCQYERGQWAGLRSLKYRHPFLHLGGHDFCELGRFLLRRELNGFLLHLRCHLLLTIRFAEAV